MGWFKRMTEGIRTPTKEKKETPEGLWYKCRSCNHVVSSDEHAQSYWVCEKCGYHERISSQKYFQLLFDNNRYTEINPHIISGDPLSFEDTKKYSERLQATIRKTGLHDAVRTAAGNIHRKKVVIAAMDFQFIGGSMGSVVGEKIARAIDYAIENNSPFIMISKSGGARMMEAAFSLMQMAKTSAKLTQLSAANLPYISILTDPTTGGVTASFAMLGDINIAEPGALIGFAGPRVVKETIGKDLPEGFQTSEFVLEHGFLDFIVERKNLREKLNQFITLIKN
ncbi:MAG: acetyl-CoA carboxylase, carboxyltransferase subunit beta [Salibacteraceae bacterium]